MDFDFDIHSLSSGQLYGLLIVLLGLVLVLISVFTW